MAGIIVQVRNSKGIEATISDAGQEDSNEHEDDAGPIDISVTILIARFLDFHTRTKTKIGNIRS